LCFIARKKIKFISKVTILIKFVKPKTNSPMKKLIFPLLFTMLIAGACKKEKSKDVDPDYIQQDIRAWYDADNNDSYFGIRLYDQQWYNRVLLTSPAYITVNGKSPILNEVNSFYECNFINEMITEGNVVYSDILKRVYTNVVSVPKTISLPHIDTLYTTKDNVITWQGEPCAGGNEKVTVRYSLFLAKSVSTSQAGATSVTVKLEANSGLTTGTYTWIRIERYVKQPLQHGTAAGGSIQSTYYSQIKMVKVY
jgi:hypothetical protein